jgi:hypothetical protein
MYVNEKMIPVETVLGIKGRSMWEYSGGERRVIQV